MKPLAETEVLGTLTFVTRLQNDRMTPDQQKQTQPNPIQPNPTQPKTSFFVFLIFIFLPSKSLKPEAQFEQIALI